MNRHIFFPLFLLSCFILKSSNGQDPDFRGVDRDGAEYKGEPILTVNFEDSGIATALNLLRSGPKKYQALHANLKGSRQEKLLYSKEQFYREHPGITQTSIHDLYRWINQNLPSEHAADGLDLKLIRLPDNRSLEEIRSLFNDSLKNEVPIILALEHYAVEPLNGKGFNWERKQRHFVLISDLKTLSQDRSSLGLLILNPIQKHPGLTDALMVLRTGEKKAKIKRSQDKDDVVNLAAPHLTIHGGDLDSWQAETWAQRCITVPAWAIVKVSN